MPANNKPMVDWPAVERRVRAGESYRSIAKNAGVSHVGISQRSRKEGWKDLEKRKAYLVSRNPEIIESAHKGEPAWNSKRTEGRREIILEARRRGAGYVLAAKAAGISEKTLIRWRADDPEFAEQIDKEHATMLVDQHGYIVDAGQRGDWKASAHILAHSPETRADWAGQAGGSGGINVVINVHRDDEPVTIDVTPTTSSAAVVS